MRFAFITCFILLAGCSDPIRDYLNEEYPPVDRSGYQAESLASLKRSLAGMGLPALSISVKLQEIEDLVLSDERLAGTIRNLSIDADRQLLNLSLSASPTFTSADWTANSEISDVLGDSTIELEADVNFSIGLVAEESVGPDGGVDLIFRLLPLFDSMKIHSVRITGEAGRKDASIIGRAIASLLNKYSANVSGYLRDLPVMSTTIPTRLTALDSPSELFQVGEGSKFDVVTEFPEEGISAPFELGSVAILVDADAISALIEFIPEEPENLQEEDVVPETYEEAREVFLELEKEVFGNLNKDNRVSVAITKRALATTLNAVTTQAKACIIGGADIPRESFREKIGIPHEDTISCSSDRDCKQIRDCNVSKSRDRRNCRGCLLRAPKFCAFGGCTGGQCIQRGNNPVCEAAKAAQNAIYDADHAARKFDCERIKEQNRLVCEAEKATEKSLCEAGKEVVKRLNRTGNIANVEGHIQGRAETAVCLNRIGFAPDLSQVRINLELEGGADIDGALEIVPLDIVGHLACQMPTRSNLDFRVAIPRSSRDIEIGVDFKEVGDLFGLEFTTSEVELPVHLKPSPTEWLLTNVDMTFKCQGLNLLKPLVLAANPFVPELRGLSSYTQPETTLFTPLAMPEQKLGGREIQTKVSATEKAISLVYDEAE